MQKEMYVARAEPKEDMVNNPSHYQADDLSCIDVMLKLYGKEAVIHFCMLNVFKYQWRCNNKGNCKQDIAKARWYHPQLRLQHHRRRLHRLLRIARLPS